MSSTTTRPEATSPAQPLRRLAARLRWPTVPVAVLLTVVAVSSLLFAGRGTNFYRDEWYFVVFRDGHDAVNYFSPHAGHLYVVPVLFYLALFATVGLNHYWVFRLVQALAVTGLGALLAAFALRRMPRVPALVVAASVITLGPGWQGVIWPFQIGFVACSAAAVGVLVLLSRPLTRRRDVLVTIILLASLGCGGQSLAVITGAAVLLAVQRQWRSWPVVVVPIAAYLAWVAWLGSADSQVQLSNIPILLSFVVQAAGAPIAAAAGLPSSANAALGLALLALVGWRVLRAEVPATLWSALAMALTFWSLIAIARGSFGTPGANRYLMPGLVFVWLIVIEAAPRLRWAAGRPAMLAGVVAAVAILVNYGGLLQGGNSMRADSRAASSELAALEAVGPELTNAVDPLTNATAIAFALPVGTYLNAVRRWGSSPSGGPQALLAEPEAVRETADAGAVQSLPAVWRSSAHRPAPGPASPPVSRSGTLVPAGRGCVRSAAGALTGSLQLTSPAPRISIRSAGPVDIEIRRFASSFTPAAAAPPVPAATWALLTLPPAVVPRVPDWKVQISWAAPLTLCSVGG